MDEVLRRLGPGQIDGERTDRVFRSGAGAGRTELRGDGLQSLTVTVGESEDSPVRGELLGDRPAYPAGRARDQDMAAHQWNSLFFVSGIVT